MLKRQGNQLAVRWESAAGQGQDDETPAAAAAVSLALQGKAGEGNGRGASMKRKQRNGSAGDDFTFRVFGAGGSRAALRVPKRREWPGRGQNADSFRSLTRRALLNPRLRRMQGRSMPLDDLRSHLSSAPSRSR